MTAGILVLYEDRRADAGSFDLHRFLVACIFDEVDGRRHLLEDALAARPLKGVVNVLGAVRDEFHDIAPRGEVVVAIFDNDRVRRLLGLPSDTGDEQVIAALLQGHPDPSRFRPYLLHKNTETLLRAIGDCGFGDTPLLQEALRHKNSRNARDAVFRRAAGREHIALRGCVMGMVPSFARIVRDLCGLHQIREAVVCGQAP